MLRHRALFVASPADASVAGALENSARNRGHSAICVLDPKQAPSIARAFRPTVVVLVAPDDEPVAIVRSLSSSPELRALPIAVLSRSKDPGVIVSMFAAGAIAVEPVTAGFTALKSALDGDPTAALPPAPLAAVDALARMSVRGLLVVKGAVDARVYFDENGVQSPDLEKLAALPPGAALDMSFDESVSAAPGAAISAAPAAAISAPEKPRVLVVEDDDATAYMLEHFFVRDGFVFARAVDGIDGFEAMLAMRPDVVVTDLMMPRADGWDLIGRARADVRTREIPVVLVSNYTDQLAELKALRVGADAYVDKAGSKTQLVAAVRALVTAKQSAYLAAAATSSSGKLSDIGPVTLLSACEYGERTGTLRVGGGFGEVMMAFVEGELRGVRAQLDGVALEGHEALAFFCELGDARWSMEGDVALLMDGPNAKPSDVLDDLARIVEQRHAAATAIAATRRTLEIVPEKARVHGGAERARAVVARVSDVTRVDADTRAAFRDLVRLGVAC